MGAVDFERFAQINPACIVAGRNSGLETQVTFAERWMVLEPVIGFIHADHAAALFERR